ncbi:MAG: beta-propeller domain-containing protein [Ruminococcus sp.]|nr:beta-propeller domain-containing protein [Ruminococcus sp.]
MKKDIDYIRDKVENSGVHAPEDMDEKYVADSIGNVYPKLDAARQEKPKRKGWKIALSATAAVLVLTLVLGIALNSAGVFNRSRSVQLPGGLALKQYSSYDQVKEEVSRIRREKNGGSFLDYLPGKYRSGDDYAEYYVEDGELAAEEYSSGSSNGSSGSSATGSSGGSSPQSHSETYEQVEGVNEADIIKTDGRYIYCVDSFDTQKIVIFSARGKDSARVAAIDITKQKAATEDEADFNYESYYGYGPVIKELYLKDDRLIVLCNDWEDSCERTMVQVYDISDIDRITMLDSMTQSGGYDSSRMIGDMLYTVSSYYPYQDRMIPCCGRGEEPEAVPANCIYSLAEHGAGELSDEFLVLSAYHTLDFSVQTESKSILGAVDDIYCNESHMYIYSTVWNDNNYRSNTQILKADLTDGIEFTAYTEVNGTIDDQYALDESDGKLRVATTSYDDWSDSNNLFVLDESLNVIGSVTDFARYESIKAVRYRGDTAYVITYEETDPLFVIDLSDPTAPEILGEVKISGFSTMLVPIGGDRLLGIGYHTENESYTTLEVQEGLKLALFDVSDKANPQVLDSASFVNCNSVVQYNPKALVYNPDRDDYIIPLNYSDWGHYDAKTGEYVYVDEYHGGVLNFRVNGDKLEQISRYSTDYEEVDRCVYVGDDIYMTYYDNDTLSIDSVPYK